MPVILDGKIARDHYRISLKERVKRLGFSPCLAIIQIGDNAESTIYIEQKKKFAASIGARVEHVKLPLETTEVDIKNKIESLNADYGTHGIIIQLPISNHLDKLTIINMIAPRKDVDGLTDTNQKLLESGTPDFIPATAKGVSLLLDFYKIDVAGKKAAVLGRSRLVGHPLAELLKIRGAHVSVCHSKTENTRDIAQTSDFVFVAIGKPEAIDASYIKPGATVIDIGINAREHKLEEEIPKRKLVGDVKYEEVSKMAAAISPVPGGVGPMTVLSLFDNLIIAAESCL